MRPGQNGFLRRLWNRLPVKALIISALVVVGVVVSATGYFINRSIVNDQIDGRVSDRGNEVLTLLSVSADEEQLQEIAGALVEGDDVRDVSYVVLDDGAGPEDIEGISPGTGSASESETALVRYLADGQRAPDSGQSTLLRELPLGDSASDEIDGAQVAIAISLDQETLSADLESGLRRSAAMLFAGVALVLLAAYVMLNFTISRPLRQLAGLDPGSLADSPPPRSSVDLANEISKIWDLVADLAARSAQAHQDQQPADYAVPDSLPGVWLAIDRQLRVIEARFAVSDESGDEVVTLALDHISDLLSAAVVDHVAATVDIMSMGEEEEFEFSIGVKSYVAYLRAGSDDYVLEITEAPADVHAVQPPDSEAGELLDGLLASMPVGILETDENGAILFANSNPFGDSAPDDLVGRTIADLLPQRAAADVHRAYRDARFSVTTQTFTVRPEESVSRSGSTNHVVPLSVRGGLAFFYVSIPTEAVTKDEDAEAKIAVLEESLWSHELTISQYEDRINELVLERDALANAGDEDDGQRIEASPEIVEPAVSLIQALQDAAELRPSADNPWANSEVIPAALAVATAIDMQMGTDYARALAAPVVELEDQRHRRFHLATFLDEIAIEATETQSGTNSRLNVYVQPSLPKSLLGAERTTRAAILQMIEYARIVSGDRALTVAAMQDTSEGRSVRVRFEVQIPAPVLDPQDINILRGCISGELPEEGLSQELRDALSADRSSSFGALDLELVNLGREATAIRCSADFEVADEVDTDYAWVRGLRTLIIQDADTTDNGIQGALSAFGIIGYVVNNEQALVEALQIGEEYSNPYRFVIADADTPGLESIVQVLEGGDAPIVLVGPRSDSAMVAAISSGYSGYVAKPVRQVELLEVILSTVEPVDPDAAFDDRISAA